MSDIIHVFAFADRHMRGYLDMDDFKALYYFQSRLLSTNMNNQLVQSSYTKFHHDIKSQMSGQTSETKSKSKDLFQRMSGQNIAHGVALAKSDNIRQIVEGSFMAKVAKKPAADIKQKLVDTKLLYQTYKAPRVKDYSKLFYNKQ